MQNFQGKVIYSFDLFDFLISYHYFVKKKKKKFVLQADIQNRYFKE